MKQYLLTLVVDVPEEEYKTWDSGCDETFGVLNKIERNAQQLVTTYYEIPLNSHPNRVLTPEGGI